MESMDVLELRDGSSTSTPRSVSEEVPLTIEVNDHELATLLCSPDHLRNLVVGFLYTSGIIADVSSVNTLVIDSERFHASVRIDGTLDEFVFKRIYTSGCGKGVIFHNPVDVMHKTRMDDRFCLKPQEITSLMRAFTHGSSEHSRTRGVHSGALASQEGILIFRDDIGRHNALDKVIGEALDQSLSLNDKVFLTTGRISSEILSKVLRCRIPVLAALGSPTNQAVKLARVANLTLISHVRGSKMDVYSGESRLMGECRVQEKEDHQ
ncbi:MAG: formate dehydrogenase accessory sulfurtransferase FdhD [Desulfomonilia bacterium]|nr:formate dehydrogenase accessory sulfurtransferase FdhD [Desulfomonilia bacterium]